MKPRSQERGQALILIVFAAVGLFAFAALAIDGSRVFSDRRHAQNAADTAVMAAALAKVRGQDYAAAAQTRAVTNGFQDGINSTVEVHLCDEAGLNPACEALPAGANAAEYIQVVIRMTTPTTFARVIGFDQVPTVVTAIAHTSGTSSTSSTPLPAMAGLRQTDCGICSGGGAFLDVNGSGVFSNSTGSSCTPPSSASIDFSGSGDYSSEGGFTMASGGQICSNPIVTNVDGTRQNGAQIFPTYNIPAPTFACSGDAPPNNGATYYPGRYTANLSINSNADFTSGTYCFDNGVTINGNATVTANGVNFRIDGGDFQTTGGSNVTFTCSNVVFYVTGAGTGVNLNGNGATTCTGVTFYMEKGSVTWNGNAANTLSAPTAPGDYKGLLIYIPASNSSQLKINGTSGNGLTGSIIAPGSEIFINGVSGSSGYNTQIVGAYITLGGASNTVINYDQSAQYSPPASPLIQLTK